MYLVYQFQRFHESTKEDRNAEGDNTAKRSTTKTTKPQRTYLIIQWNREIVANGENQNSSFAHFYGTTNQNRLGHRTSQQV